MSEGEHDLARRLADGVFRLAPLIQATEAAGFMLGEPGDVLALAPVVHIRPDASDNAVRAAALRAFKDIAQRFLGEGRDGCVTVEPPEATRPAQRCLVALVRLRGAVYGVMTYIVRCDYREARRRMEVVQRGAAEDAT